MREDFFNFKDFVDSKEIVKAREPNFILFFIYFILIIMIIALFWMWYGKIDIVVKADGIVRPGKSVSIVRNALGGKLASISFREGEEVTKGDNLFMIKTSSLQSKIEALQKKIALLEEDILLLNRFIKALHLNENLFSKEELLYHNLFLVYQIKLNQLELDYEQARDRYLRQKSIGNKGIPEVKLRELEIILQNSKLTREKYINETIVNIKKEIENKKEESLQLKLQLIDFERKLDQSCVKSPITGTVQVLNKINEGEFIPGGLKVLRIVPPATSDYLMEISVKNRDISHLEEGQLVKYRFLSLPFREYGVLKGKIYNISRDVISNIDRSMAYKIEASIEKKRLKNKRGEIEYIRSGMISEARIVVGQKRILKLVLQKLDLID